MPRSIYSWKKVYALQTPMNDDVKEGDIVSVDSSGGPSNQKVLSVTVTYNQKGEPFKTVLVRPATAADNHVAS